MIKKSIKIIFIVLIFNPTTDSIHANSHSWRALGVLLTTLGGIDFIQQCITNKKNHHSYWGQDIPTNNQILIKSGAVAVTGLYLIWHNYKHLHKAKSSSSFEQATVQGKHWLSKLFA